MNEQPQAGPNRFGVPDLRDVANLERFRTRLAHEIQQRRDSGMTLRMIGNTVGFTEDAISAVFHPETHDPANWTWDHVIKLCRAGYAVPRLKTFGIEGSSSVLEVARAGQPQLLGVGAMDLMVSARKGRGLSESQIAEKLGIKRGVVYQLEHSDNPRLSTIMRYGRALGGWVEFDILGAW